mmetsp:Transcript_7693/g.13649  ORF Transcript_7693/g.13649 Transcript_7693/m.13649 type:complete len:80 (-) Transcript_7693:1171-1410(-)
MKNQIRMKGDAMKRPMCMQHRFSEGNDGCLHLVQNLPNNIMAMKRTGAKKANGSIPKAHQNVRIMNADRASAMCNASCR